jgi:Ca2+-binding RTX toxin-like protein
MSGFKLNLSDLQFVLYQIKVAEAHAAGIPLTSILLDAAGQVIADPNAIDLSVPATVLNPNTNTQVPNPLRPYYVTDAQGNLVPNPLKPAPVLAIPDPHVPVGLRTVDGSDNNIIPGREQWGASGEPMPRLFEPNYINDADGDTFDTNGDAPGGLVTNTNYAPASGNVVDADPRTISNLIVDMSFNNPAAIVAALTFAGSEDIYGPTGDLAEAQAAVAAYEVALAAIPGGATPAEKLVSGAEALEVLQVAFADLGIELGDDGSLLIPNIAADEGLSAPFNAWMTFFGQFFDHGLDLISKGGAGTVYVPLAADDPLITHGPDGIPGTGDEASEFTQFMVLTRATTVTNADGEPSQRNVTTPFVDQNQTYTSHASHQVFLREYELVGGRPVATGKLLGGEDGGLATWADVKHQAEIMLGIELTDLDVGAVPMLLTDAYGEFVRHPTTGMPQILAGVTSTGAPIYVSGTPAAPINPSAIQLPVGTILINGNTIEANETISAARTFNAFLDDIAHNAVPVTLGGVLQQDPDTLLADGSNAVTVTGNAVPSVNGRNTQYDNELLDRHYITGDGRGNENIGLTAVHHIFHSEHNRQVDAQKLTILLSGDLAFVNEWFSSNITAGQLNGFLTGYNNPATLDKGAYLAANPVFNSTGWDGERLFQAARFATEMQYQHLVFEEFARKIQPNIDVFVFNAITDIDPSIFSEFANVVYRFGHSMLTENMPRIDANGAAMTEVGLVESFLNPVLFDNNGAISHDEGAAAVVRGMTIERGNEIDEFITGALRNNLLGLPLDLAAINIARGRDTGMPTLNQAREQLYAASSSTFLKPYTSWVEFAANLKNPLSVVNFIAAYGTHESITVETTIEGKRDAAWDLVFGGTGTPADRVAFLNATGAYAGGNLGGLNDIDLWVGGLAEKKMPFGGFLGSTFNAVFELQLENLQDGDRFYYLTRTQGQNFLNSLEQNSFAKMIMANTSLADPGPDGIRGTADDIILRHIGVDAFAAYDFVLEVDVANQADYDPDNHSSSGRDPTGNDPVMEALGFPKVLRTDPSGVVTENYLRVFGGEHNVIGGTDGNDTIIADFGDDGIWGDAGDDRIEAGAGVDLVNGGAGNDIITDSGDSGDFLKGDEGDDVIANSNGLDIIMGGSGKDVVFVGVDATEVFGGEGDDFILGGDDMDFLMGNEGDDWIEGGGGFDTTAGDNSELFFNSAIKGHDVMFAGTDEHDFDAESGDDIMVQGESVIRNEGMFGFDWSIYKGVAFGADADLRTPIFTTEQADILRNRFDKVEALSGWNHDDILRGDDRLPDVPANNTTLNTAEGFFFQDELTQAGVDRIDGLRELFGNLIWEKNDERYSDAQLADPEQQIAFNAGNILLGGGGSDILQGNGGNDVIDGDAWLNVRIKITAKGIDGQSDSSQPQIATIDSLKHVFVAGEGPAAWVGKSLFELMLDRTIVPSQLHIVREIVVDDGDGDIDVAVFNDTFFDEDGDPNYSIVRNIDGSVTVTHLNVTAGLIDPQTGRAIISDGVDTLRNIEIARFRDVDIRIDNDPPTDIQWNAVVPGNTTLPGNGTIATLSTVDPDSTTFTYALLTGSSPNFAVNANTGVVTRSGGNLAENQTYTLIIQSTDDAGNIRVETFVIRTGTDNGNGTDVISAATAQDHIIYGEEGNDTLTGGAGNDTLFGQDDNDTLVGGLGNDVLHGGAGTDTASYATANGAVVVNLGTASASGAAGNDTLNSVENVIGSSSDDTLTGDGNANVLTGGAGADALHGAGGNDTLNGDAGNDTLTGGTGNDTLNGGANDDTYVFGLADGEDTIQETSGTDRIVLATGGAALATLSFTEGNGGNLGIVVGATEITVTDHFATTGEEVEAVEIAAGTTYLGHDVSGTFALSADDSSPRSAAAGVATILSGSAASETLTGGSAKDLIFGGAGNDTLNGGDGDDLLVGGAGNDTIIGGGGNDTIVVDIDGDPNDNDTISGGTGTDTLAIIDTGTGSETLTVAYNGSRITQIEGAGSINADVERVTADLGAGTGDTIAYTTTSNVTVNLAAATASGFFSITNVENATTGSGNDTFTGSAANNAFSGGTGNDTYRFGLADGSDSVTDSSGTDSIVFTQGGVLAALNVLDNGNGTGDAVLTVGSTTVTAVDHFDTAAEAIETVTFAAGTSFAGHSIAGTYVLSTDDAGTRDGAAGAATILAGSGAANTINGSTSTDILFGNGGNDTLNGNGGADLLIGGTGDDTINGGAGNDTIVWNSNTAGNNNNNSDGRDFIDGGADSDTFVLSGNAGTETFHIYTRAAWQTAGNNLNQLNDNTEIVVTRNGSNNAAIVAELDNIEEIVVNGSTASPPGGPVNTTLGGDTIQVFGNFSQTSLALNTITINGGTGDDTVDFSALSSAHRIVFRSNGGTDTIVGTIRPQDVVELANGQDISTYTLADNGNGTKTLSNGTHSITFTGAVPPQFQNAQPAPGNDEGVSGAFEYTPSDLAGLKALVNGLQPAQNGDDDVPTGVRTLSGDGNNEDNPTWGAADQAFIRITNPHYGEPDADGNRAINPIFEGLDPRTISNILGAQEAGLPKAGNDANIFFMAMGQYIDHGLDFLPKGNNGTIQIGAPGGGDPFSGNPADLTRGTVIGYDADGNPLHKNQTSPYVDQNQAYGSHELVGQFLRESDGNQGYGMRLFSGAPDPSNPEFNLLPTLRELIQHHWQANTIFTDTGLPGGQISFRAYYTNYPIDAETTGTLFDDEAGAFDPGVVSKVISNFMGSGHPLLLDTNPFINVLDHYVVGDGRGNENFALTAIHTVWARNHNFHVDGLLAAGFQGTAEEVFQAAKMINEAEYQRVVFDEYLETLLGGLRSEGTHGFEEYDPNANAAISHEFAAAAFRFGHSLIGQKMTVLDADGNPIEVNLFDAFLNPTNDADVFTGPLPPGYVPQPGYAQYGVNAIIGGNIAQPSEAVDFNIVDAVRNDLVRISADLFAFNVARGWDVGLGTLNQIRMDLAASTDPYVSEAVGFAGGNLSAYTSWEDFQARNGLSNAVIAQFKQAYPDLVLAAEDIAAFQAINPDIQLVNGNTVKGIDRVDFWVGGLAEKHINDGIVGQTFWVVLSEQFERLQDADRFYYISRFDDFDFYENFIDGQEFADIVARNTGMTDLPEHMFRTDEIDDDDGEDTGIGGNDDEDDDDDSGGPVDDDEDDDTDEDSDDDEDLDEDDDSPAGDDDAPVVVPPPASSNIVGTALDDVLVGTANGDLIFGMAGNDAIIAGAGADIITAGAGDDFIEAGDGRDVIFAGDDDDHVFGGADDDLIYGDGGDDRIFAGDGNDMITGGKGNDTIFGNAGNDKFVAEIGDGDDVYYGDDQNGGTGIDTLDMSAATTPVTVNLGTGLMGHGSAVSSQTGNDTLWGIENVITGAAADTIIASDAVNVMDGGAGADIFRFRTTEAADGDTIVGFEPGDRIDLTSIDANTGVTGDQAFHLVNGNSSNAAAQLVVVHETRADGDYTVIQGHVNGGGDPDFQINIKGHHTLTATDFNL